MKLTLKEHTITQTGDAIIIQPVKPDETKPIAWMWLGLIGVGLILTYGELFGFNTLSPIIELISNLCLRLGM